MICRPSGESCGSCGSSKSRDWSSVGRSAPGGGAWLGGGRGGGVPPLQANATSTVALWPGALGSMWGYRDELAGARGWAVRLAVPSLLGCLAGALLLLRTSESRFEAIVPLLILGATLLFLVQ